MVRIVSAHQPNFVPYWGYFEKFLLCDGWIDVDDVLLQPRLHSYRNQIVGPDGQPRWLTVGVEDQKCRFQDAQVRPDGLDQLCRYVDGWYRGDEATEILSILRSARKFSRLVDMNRYLLEFCTHVIMSLQRSCALASGTGLSSTGTARIYEECKYLDGTVYLSGAIAKSEFPRVQKLVVDLAAETDDLAGATRLLGISMDDPILGLTRLRRGGVSVNETQQALIRSYVESGDKMKAQAVLLDVLESKFGGNAKAM